MKARIIKKNGECEIVTPILTVNKSKTTAFLDISSIGADCAYIDFGYDFLTSETDKNGYSIAPRGTKEGGTMLCRFTDKSDCEYISDSNYMPVFGFKSSEKSIFAVVTQMTYEYKIVVGVKNGIHYIYPRFFVDNKNNYENIEIDFYSLSKGADYNDMAALYREIKSPTPLSEKVKKYPDIKYAVDSVELRIRMAWKPVPSPVLHQTLENEPPVIVGCTTDRAKDIIDGLKRRGVDKVEICLVGIETKGHDGRWPQLLPIEESIGGETELVKLCKYGQDAGYKMVVHTNSTEMYEISDDWNENELIVTHDGEYSTDSIPWGGGLPYHLCPKCAAEYAERNHKKVEEMGFKGLHYIDVLTNFPPRNCYSKKHPMTARQSAEQICQIGQMTRDMFGGFASEGGFDYAPDVLDYALYTSYNLYGKQHPVCDETIPFWQLVYHGSILCNPSTETVNWRVKDEMSHLKFIEFGGRPLAYINSKYVDEGGCGNWMGESDLLCATDELLNDSLDRIARMYNEYKDMSDLQYEKMLSHEKLADGIYCITYSNGTKITVDYNKMNYKID